jgi:transcriptional regulator with XRE-family HTH domain
MSIDLPTLGMRLREARERRGLTQDQAADSIGASPSAIADIESGQRSLSTLELCTLAHLFRVPVNHLFTDGPIHDEATPASPMLASETVERAVEAYRRGEASQGWLRDVSDELGMPADELIALAEADE